MRNGIFVGLVVVAAMASGTGYVSAQVIDGSGDTVITRRDPWPS